MFNCKPVFFLDEIQIVDHWEKFARRLSDQGYRVYITGSNAKMLSSEIATTLGGRYMIQNVYPFSFNEHLLSQGIDPAAKNTVYQFRVEILKAFEIYFKFGGLPPLYKKYASAMRFYQFLISITAHLKVFEWCAMPAFLYSFTDCIDG